MKGGLTKLIYCEVKDQRVFIVSQGQSHVLLCTSEGEKKGKYHNHIKQKHGLICFLKR